MGYTISVKFKTEQEQDKMENFLKSQSDILNKMNMLEHGSLTNGFHLGKIDPGSGYAPKQKNLLGCHVSLTPRYIWDLCAWMAVKADCKDKKSDLFFYYDSKKMLVTFDSNNTKNTVVEESGVPVYDPSEFKKEGLAMFMIHYLRGEQKKRKEILGLFVELNDKWNQFNLQYENPSQLKKNKP
jgi:hypothetical protein